MMISKEEDFFTGYNREHHGYLNRQCPFCGQLREIKLSVPDYRAWRDGAYVQDAFHYLSPDQREIVATGICPECFPKGEDEV